MEEKHILLTGYSQVGSETFSTVLERIDKALAKIENQESQSERDLQSKEEYKVLREKIENNAKQIVNVDTTKEGRLLFNTVNPTWELAVENTTFEKDYLNYAYTTAESAFKELVVPSHKRNVLQGERLEDVQSYPIETVFAFTTNKVKTNSLDYTYFHDGESIPLHIDKDKESRPQTYQEFINSRFKSILEFATDGEKTFSFVPIEVSETDAESNKSIGNVLEMVSKVDKYIKENAEYKVIIHVDMSGGFRHIPLILMLVLNILQRSKHNIGEIMYTMLLPGNVKVERINDIFDMQRFTNGAHEFIKFGSGSELSEFYDLSKEKTKSEDSSAEYDAKISNFTTAVKVFSDAITLSDRNEFRKAVKGIKSAWENLEVDISEYDKAKELEQQEREENKKTPSAIENNLGLLQTFSPRIKKEYELLWETDNELDYILWCLEHNFVQQALTLYSEILPEAVLGGENPIIRIKFKKELLDVYNKSEDIYGFYFWVLNHFNWDKGTNKNKQEEIVEEKTSDEKKESEEKAKQSKSEIALDKLRESINIDYIEMPWLNNRKNVEDAILKIQVKIATILQPILDEMNEDKNKEFLKILKAKVDEFESKDPKEIYECYIQQICTIVNFDDEKLSSLAERNAKLLEEKLDVKKDGDTLDIKRLQNALIDKATQEKLIISLAKIVVYPNRMHDVLVKIQKELSENSTEKDLEGTINGKQLIEYVKKYNSELDDYYDRLVTAYILESKITAIGSVDKFIKEWTINEKPWVNRKRYIQFSQIKNETIGNIFMPSTYERKVLFPYKLSKLDENTLIKSLYSYLCAKKVEVNSEKWLQKDKKIFSKIKSILMKDVPGIDQDTNWKTLLPKSLNGDLDEKDQNGVSYLDLLILRSIFVPYRFFKQVRNDSVHARIERNEMIVKDELIELLEKSVKWIKTLQNSLK